MTIRDQIFDEERALYGLADATVIGCTFDGPADGESAFKECRDLRVEDCHLRLRYPFWHDRRVLVRGCDLGEGCRAALWYDEDVTLENCRLEGVKALRECDRTRLSGCDITSPEFAWRCRGVDMTDCRLTSEYPFFECRDLTLREVDMTGKYSFQYVENARMDRVRFQTKDAFWHTKNVTVTDSVIRGEYLGWYSENLTLIRCHIAGTQPLCYCKGLTLIDCTTEDCDLAFEYSEVEATVKGDIVSVKNPLAGHITVAGKIGEIIRDEFARGECIIREV